uniref:Uncharacterized protein n=1 Tax=Lotus japonicus TaxID=34305 RepID=I3SQA3_LOTJA|nr:unknown [Lotus japonicus]
MVVRRSMSMGVERCPDLNLELTISPPRHHEPDETGERNICFGCSLGLQNSKDCSCGIGSTSSGDNTNASSSSAAYDFLGLKPGVWDYTSLEMK